MEIGALAGSVAAVSPRPRRIPSSLLRFHRIVASTDFHHKEFGWMKWHAMPPSMNSWRSVASHMDLREGAASFPCCPQVPNEIRKKRATIQCATMDQVQAEKKLVENEARRKMDKTIHVVRFHFNSVRTGRAHPDMLDRLEVEYHGSPVRVRNIAEITTTDSSTLHLQPHDKSCLKDIEKAIVHSDLRLTPNNDGEAICIHIPQLTSERRKELLRVVHKLAEEGKAAIRKIRRDALKTYEKHGKEKKLSGDNVRDLWIEFQEVADAYIKKIDAILKEKEKEIMTV